MLALVGVVLSFATAAAGSSSAGPTAFDDICITGGPACEAPAALEQGERVYATPAQIDCPAPTGARVSNHLVVDPPQAADDGQLAVGACSLPVLDFRYRVSRLPESERPTGALRPQRGRRTRSASCTGLPPERGTQLSTGFIQPAAVYATWEMIPPPSGATRATPTSERASRTLEPLDRPPRA